MDNILTVWKVSGQSEKFLKSLESFRTVEKVSGQSEKFPDNMEKFLTVWKVLGQSGKFPDSLESFQTAQKVYRQSGKKKLLFSTVSLHKSMEPYRYTINLFFVCAWVDEYKLSKSWRYIKTCRENNLRTLVHVAKTIYALLAHMSQKQFTHFGTCRKNDLRAFGIHVAKTIYALRPESFCA